MLNTIKVRKIEKGLLYNRAIVEAEFDCRAYFDSFLGRMFVLHEGSWLNLKVQKNTTLVGGDRISLFFLVSEAKDWTEIPWGWGLRNNW